MNKKILILSLVLVLLSSFAAATTDNFFISDIVSGYYLNDSTHESFSETSTLRFSDTFTGTNGDPISSTNWDTYYTGGASQVTKISSNTMKTGLNPPCGVTRDATTQSDNTYSITNEAVFNFSMYRNSDITNEQIVYLQDTHLSSGSYETGKYTGIRATSAGTYELVNVNASSSVNVLETISATTTTRNDFQLRIDTYTQTYKLYLDGNMVGTGDIYFPTGNYYITLSMSLYDCPTSRFGYFDDIYLYDNNLTIPIRDYFSSDDGVLYGKSFNNAINYDVTFNNHTGDKIKFGGYYDFNPALTSYVEVPFDSSFPSTTTLCAWAYLNGTSSVNYLVDFRESDGGPNGVGYIAVISNTLASQSGSKYVNGVPSTSFISDSWNHFCIAGQTTSLLSDYQIGARFNLVDYWNGSLDEVTIWNRTLSQTEIQKQMVSNAIVNPDGLIAYYDFNEESGSTVYDNKHLSTGPRQNTSTITDPIFSWDKSINFDGIDDYVEIPYNSSFPTTTTVCAWAYLNESLTTKYLLDFRKAAGGPNGVGYIAVISNTLASQSGSKYINGVPSTSFAPNSWNHFCIAGQTTSLLSDYQIGTRFNYDNFWNGNLADFRVYNGTLTQDEITTIYNGLKTIDFTAEEYLTGNTISNFEVQTIYGNDTTTTGIASLNVPYGTLNYNWYNALGYYNLTSSLDVETTTTENIIAYDTILNITAVGTETNNSFQDFTINISSLGIFETTTDGNALFYFNEEQINATISGPTIATQSQIINLSSGYNNYTFSIYESNSIRINIYDQINNDLLNNTNITLSFISDDGQFSNVTSTGVFYIYDLEDQDYQIEFTSDNYETSNYYVTVTNFSTQSLNAYLLPTGSASTIFTFKDRNLETTIEGISLSMEQVINDEWVLINVLTSDISGRVVFNYDDGYKYRFSTTNSGYEDKLFTLDPIIFTSYNIWLDKVADEKTDQDYSRVSIKHYPEVFYNNENNTVTLYFISLDGEFQDYGFNATYKGEFISGSGVNAIGEVLTDVLLIEDAVTGDRVVLNYYYRLTDGTTKTYTLPYTISNIDSAGTFAYNAGETYGLGLFERTLITVLVVVGVAGTAFLFGGLLAAGLMAMLVFGYITYIGFLSAWVTIPSMILIFIITSWGATR